MDATAFVVNPDAIKVTITVDLTISELRAVLQEMEQITHANKTAYWIFKGHLDRVLRRVQEKVESREYEEEKA